MAILADEAIKEINDYIHVQGLQWAKEFIEFRKKDLKKRGIEATGDLIDSLQEDVTKRLQQAALVRIEIAFNLHGRFIEMKGLKPPKGGDSYIKALEEWLEEKGFVQKFTNKLVAKRKLKEVPPNILNQLAWSVAVSRSKRDQRPRQWYNKPKQASISDLYNRVAAGLSERVAKEIVNAFKQ